jgi:arylformamidase
MTYIDLTHPLATGISVYPGTREPRFEAATAIERDGFAEMNIDTTTHTGTHIDAPAHILPNSKSLDAFSLDKFIGKGMAVDCRGLSSITLDHIRSRESQIRGADFILFFTGWQEKWNTPHYLDPFPTLTPEAVRWLLQFPLKALGFDALSVDALDDAALPNHHLLLAKEVLIIENLTNLDRLPHASFAFQCIPLNIKEADAAPVRAFAGVETSLPLSFQRRRGAIKRG